MTAERFRKEYLPLQDELYRVAFYILESSPDAEDAVQDLYLKLWDAADALDGISSPKPTAYACCATSVWTSSADAGQMARRSCPCRPLTRPSRTRDWTAARGSKR